MPQGSRPEHKVAYNALALRPHGAGISTYIRELLTHIRDITDASMVASVAEDSADELPPGVEPLLRPRADGVRRALQGLRPVVPTSLFHGLDVDVPLRPRAPTVTTVHDLSVFDVPWAFSRRRVLGERALVRHALRNADTIIAVSSFTAERISTLFGLESVVIPEAPPTGLKPPTISEIGRVRTHYKLPDRFVLHVGSIEPRKNVSMLAQVCHDVGVPLVLAGPAGWQVETPSSALTIGFVPTQDLPGLYGSATITAYMSRYEGFGLPPLEAMACGCPVVTTKVPSVELLDEGVVIILKSDQPEELAEAIRSLLNDTDRQQDLRRKGPAAVRRLSWKQSAEETLAVYSSLNISIQRSTSRNYPPSDTDASEADGRQ